MRIDVLSLFPEFIAQCAGFGVVGRAQERALRQGSARAADGFDLIVAAPGSQTRRWLPSTRGGHHNPSRLAMRAVARVFCRWMSRTWKTRKPGIRPCCRGRT